MLVPVETWRQERWPCFDRRWPGPHPVCARRRDGAISGTHPIQGRRWPREVVWLRGLGALLGRPGHARPSV